MADVVAIPGRPRRRLHRSGRSGLAGACEDARAADMEVSHAVLPAVAIGEAGLWIVAHPGRPHPMTTSAARIARDGKPRPLLLDPVETHRPSGLACRATRAEGGQRNRKRPVGDPAASRPEAGRPGKIARSSAWPGGSPGTAGASPTRCRSPRPRALHGHGAEARPPCPPALTRGAGQRRYPQERPIPS
jgi:hypothetical protein